METKPIVWRQWDQEKFGHTAKCGNMTIGEVVPRENDKGWWARNRLPNNNGDEVFQKLDEAKDFIESRLRAFITEISL